MPNVQPLSAEIAQHDARVSAILTAGIPIPTPAQVSQGIATVQRYRRQVEAAREDVQRRRAARANGYRGPLTRGELALLSSSQGTPDRPRSYVR